MKVIAGRLKGRSIPFVNAKYGNADITSGKVKEALFSILAHDIVESSFLDLYACSGQIAYEAFSRGASFVVANEYDKRRFAFIGSCIEKYGIADSMKLFNYRDTLCIRYLSKRTYLFDIIFLDPPYIKRSGPTKKYGEILDLVNRSALLKSGGLVIVQYYSKNDLESIPENFEHLSDHEYGSTTLTLFRYQKK